MGSVPKGIIVIIVVYRLSFSIQILVKANGGFGCTGGGGGRTAIYYSVLNDDVIHEVTGGEGLSDEHGASGTVYLKREGEDEWKVVKSYNDFPTARSQVRVIRF